MLPIVVPRILRLCYLGSVNAGVRRLGSILSSCRASPASCYICSFVTIGRCVKIVFVKEGGFHTHSHLVTQDYTAELGGGVSPHLYPGSVDLLLSSSSCEHIVQAFTTRPRGRQIHHWRDGENRFLLFKALEPYLIFGQSSHPLDGLEGSLGIRDCMFKSTHPTMVSLASHLATSSSNSVNHLTLGPLQSLGTGVVHLLTWSVPTLNS